MRFPLLALILTSCAQRENPRVTLRPEPSPCASPVNAWILAPPHVTERAIIGRDLVDLDAMRVVHTLTADDVDGATVSDTTAYLWAHSPRGAMEMRAYAVPDGSLRWSQRLSECFEPVATSRGVFCSNSSAVAFFRESDGHVKAVAAKARTIVAMGRRVLVLHDDQKLDSFDEGGVLMASATVPVMPSAGWMMRSLEVAGDVACGAEQNDASTTVFCVDAAPRVVWSKTVPVGGGGLAQADRDTLVVASGHFANTASSEILRTRDGLTLLHMGVRLAAALSTGGVLDAALTAEPLALYDGAGALKWTSAPDVHDDSLRARRAGSNVVLAIYSPIWTGTRLLAVDASSGVVAWRASVESLPIGHSEYANGVELRMHGATALLLGHESSQELAEWFDSSTGRRLASVVRGH